VVSIALTGGATLVSIWFPETVGGPLLEFYLPRFAAGEFTRNLGQLLGLTAHWSLVPLGVVLALGVGLLWRFAKAGEPPAAQ
jgi:hypothetical protein